MIRAILFDLDGTLLYTLQDIADAMNRALVRHGLPARAVEDYKFLVGNGAKVLAERAVGENTSLTEAVLRDYMEDYSQHSLVSTRPYEGVPETLAALRSRGIRLAVFSNKPDGDTKRVIERFFPGVFAHVQGQRQGIPLKPDPAVPLDIARSLGIAPEAWAYLGDSGVDMRCANRAGMRPIGALWGYRDREELLAGGAESLIAKPGELLQIL